MGRRLGHATRRLARRATAIGESMVKSGVHPLIATALLRIVQIASVAILIYVVVWLGVLIALAMGVARLMEHADLRGHCCSCPHCHCQCVWCNQLFWDDDT